MIAKPTKTQIEEAIGRPLAAAEVLEVGQVAQLTEAHLAVARLLVQRQLVLCANYLRGVVDDIDTKTAADFMDAVLKFEESIESWCDRRQRGDA